MEAVPEVIAIAVAGGFPHADSPWTGVTVTATTDGNCDLACDLSSRVADEIWSRRDRLIPTCVSPDDAIDRVLDAPLGRPVVLADVADNPGAGAPGDGTWILRRLLDRSVANAVVGAIPDPAVVAQAVDAGPGATIPITLGGKVDLRGGPSLELTVKISAISDGVFPNLGPMGTGATTRLGRTATLQVDGVTIVVCERSVQTADPGVFHVAEVDLAAARVVVVKSSVHYRAAFGEIAQAMFDVEAGGVSSSDLTSFPFRSLVRPIFPLDPEVTTRD